jgi:hypothetical protein
MPLLPGMDRLLLCSRNIRASFLVAHRTFSPSREAAIDIERNLSRGVSTPLDLGGLATAASGKAPTYLVPLSTSITLRKSPHQPSRILTTVNMPLTRDTLLRRWNRMLALSRQSPSW